MIKTHIIVDFYVANPETLARSENLRAAIESACFSLGHRIRQDNYIQFEPFGVTATVVSDLFHFSIHTWPEHCSCAVDLYSARDNDFAKEITEALKINFESKEYDFKIMDRRMIKL